MLFKKNCKCDFSFALRLLLPEMGHSDTFLLPQTLSFVGFVLVTLIPWIESTFRIFWKDR